MQLGFKKIKNLTITIYDIYGECKMAGWKKCPRCDLNYIREEEEYCAVCNAELKKGPQLVFAIDDDEDMEVESMELCPRCHQNYIKPGENMCKKCAEELDYKDSREDLDEDESWKEFLDDEEEEEEESEEMLSLARLAEEEGEELFDDEEEEEDFSDEEAYSDDFDIPDIDEGDFEDDEELDEEDEDAEDDEDF